jgi:hypothetical protein
MADQAQAYDADLALWAERQARALRDAGRAGTNLPIDWENVAEEIDALGKSQAREMASRVRTILVHLIKLQAAPATEHRGGWRETVIEQRSEIERIIADPPGLLQAVGRAIAREIVPARRQASVALTGHGETPQIDLDQVSCSETEVVGIGCPTKCNGDRPARYRVGRGGVTV